MSLKSETSRGFLVILVAAALGALAALGADWMRSEGGWTAAAPAVTDLARDDTNDAIPAGSLPASSFETVLESRLSWGTPILNVFALCHGRTRLETGDNEFRHFRIEGVDWLEYYESAALPAGEIAIRGFRAPMASLTAATADAVLVVTAEGENFIGGAWHITASGEIDDAIELEPAPGLAIPACLDAGTAAMELNRVFAGDHSPVRGRPRR